MADDGLPNRPLTNAEKILALRLREAAEKRKAIDELQARIKLEHGAELEERAAALTADDSICKDAVDALTKVAAERNIDPKNITDDAVFVAVIEAEKARELIQKQEAEQHKAIPEQPSVIVGKTGAEVKSAPTVEQPVPEESWQQTPGSKARTDAAIAERLAQKARMNNADMDRLAGFGPKHANYEPLNANQIQQRFGNPELIAKYNQDDQQRKDATKASAASTKLGAASDFTASHKKNDGLFADFITPQTKKAVEEEIAKDTIQQQWKTTAKGMTR